MVGNKCTLLTNLVLGAILLFAVSCENSLGPDAEGEILQSNVEMSNVHDGSVTLYAGQHMDVGTVSVHEKDGKLNITFDTEGWCLQETHLQLWQGEISKNLSFIKGKGNPAPGQFKYSAQHDCATSYTYTVDEDPSEPWKIAAHAVVQKTKNVCELTEESGIVYGVERNTNKIYSVDIKAGTASLEFSSSTNQGTNISPNGLAFDFSTKRVYYTNYQIGVNPRNLYYYDYADNTEHIAGVIGMEIAAADFYNGKYYAIDSYPASDNMHEISFNADGSMATKNAFDISGNKHKWTFHGDIAIKDGILHGWGKCHEHNGAYEFFTYDLSTKDFVLHNVPVPNQFSLQLAFGSNGELYGHQSSGLGSFFEVNTSDGSITGPITMAEGSRFRYTDLASGLQCKVEQEGGTETAWGNGPRFTSKGNWATYFEYNP